MPSNPFLKSRQYVRLSTESSTSDLENALHPDTPLMGNDHKNLPPIRWRALFFFTSKVHTPLLVLAIVVSLASGAAIPAQSFVIGKLFDGLVSFGMQSIDSEHFLRQETRYILYILILAAATWLLRFVELTLWLAFGELQASSARNRLFNRLLRKDLTWYDRRKDGMGALLPRFHAQIRDLQLATAQPLSTLFTVSATALLSLIQAFALSWSLTLVTISTAPLLVACVLWAGRGIQDHIEKQHESMTAALSVLANSFQAIETVKSFNGQAAELKQYKSSIDSAARWYTRIAHANALQMALFVFLSISTFVQGFYYGSVLVSEGKTSTAQVITTFLSAIDAFMSIQEILPQMIVLEKGRAAGFLLRSMTTDPPVGPNSSPSVSDTVPESCHGDIKVQNLSFAYPMRPDHLVLENVSLHIPRGQTVFLIGSSGSAKSTLVQLLLQMYPIQHGQITLDGYSISSLNHHWLRAKITLVEQNSVIFDESIFDNIGLGRQDGRSVTEYEAMAAAEFAMLKTTIMDFPEGIHSRAGPRGCLVSGGQRQRIALARAKVRDAPILILDESTSALDQTNRQLIMNAIRRWRQGKTTIIITHDMSQIGQDDHIFILEHGRLVQTGCRKDIERLEGSPLQVFLKNTKDGKQLHSEGRGSNLQFIENDPDLAKGILSRADAPERPVGRDLAPPSTSRSSPGPAELISSSADTMDNKFARLQRGSPIELMDLTHKAERHETDLSSFSSTRRRFKKHTDFLPQNSKEIRALGKPNPVRKDNSDLLSVLSLQQILCTVWPNLDWSYRLYLILGFCSASVHAVASPIFANVLSNLLDTFSIPGGDEQQALICAMEILAIAFTDAIQVYLLRFLLELVGQCWVDSLRSEALERILDQPIVFFQQEENRVTLLTESLDRNAEEMRNLLGRFATFMYIAILLCATSIGWAIIAQWVLALTAFAVVPYIYTVSTSFAQVSRKWEALSNDAHEHADMIFAETFTNIRTVRALTLESYFRHKYARASHRTLAIGLRRSLHIGFFCGCSDSSTNISIAILFYVGSQLVVHGTSIRSVIQVLTILMITVANINAVLAFIPQIGSSLDTASRLLRLTNLPKNSHEHLGFTPVDSVGDIVFDHIHFAYPSRPHHPIFHDLTLRLPEGSITALVGASGSGKSTLANLLLRLYPLPPQPTSSPHPPTITLGNHDIQTLCTSSLRHAIVLVPQHPTIFPLSVAANITYPHAPTPDTLPNVVAAATHAGLDAFIRSLPQGYATRIGDGGLQVSGGQARRVALARALVRAPRVLVLDESSVGLDPVAIRDLGRVVRGLVVSRRSEGEQGREEGEEAEGEGERRNGRMTVLMITHEKAMMEIADQVVVLERGRVKEEN